MLKEKPQVYVADTIFEYLNKLGSIKKLGRIIYYYLQDLVLGDVPKRNQELSGKYKGEKCFLFATGTSVLDVDLSQFHNEYTFACNHFYRHPDFCSLNPTFYFLIEPYYGRMFGKQHVLDFQLLHSSVSEGIACCDAEIFLSGSAGKSIQKQGFYSGRNKYYILSGERILSAKKQELDITKRITFADGVVFSMIAAAMYMGFKEIYLIGLGYTLKPVIELHFYNYVSLPLSSTVIEREKWKEKIKAEYGEKNVYKIEETATDIRATLVSYRESSFYDQYRIVQDEAKKRGVRIINVVPDGFESPVFESISMEELLKILR